MKVRCIGGSLHNKFVELQNDCQVYVAYKDQDADYSPGSPFVVETESYNLEVIIKDYKRHLYLIIEGLDVHRIVDALNEMNKEIKCLNVRGVVYEQL